MKNLTECYRYEYSDGGGPWFYPDGRPRRIDNVPIWRDAEGALSGFDTEENLKEYMRYREIDVSKMKLFHYINAKIVYHSKISGKVFFYPTKNTIKLEIF